jgi:hypothetical protein
LRLLVAGIAIFCLGISLPFLATNATSTTEVPSAPAGKALGDSDQRSDNGYGYSLDGDYLAVFAEEDEAGGKHPKNTVLLGTLVLVFLLGLARGWLGVSGWMRRKPEACSSIGGYFHSVVHLHQRRGVATLSGVFRL